MGDWMSCPGCQLRHTRRADGLCPRCKQPVDGAVAAPAEMAAPVEGSAARPIVAPTAPSSASAWQPRPVRPGQRASRTRAGSCWPSGSSPCSPTRSSTRRSRARPGGDRQGAEEARPGLRGRPRQAGRAEGTGRARHQAHQRRGRAPRPAVHRLRDAGGEAPRADDRHRHWPSTSEATRSSGHQPRLAGRGVRREDLHRHRAVQGGPGRDRLQKELANASGT